MNKILKVITLIFVLCGMQNFVLASSIDRTISQSDIHKDAVSVSVRDIETEKIVYKLNPQKPTMPASTLKMVTLVASIDTLGKDYKFSTKLFKNANNELFLQLGADPFLTSANLNNMFQKSSSKIKSPKNIYIDDFIFDNTEWGEGWQWDDEFNPLMQKFSSYNIDNNKLGIVIAPTEIGNPANIYTTKFYPITFMNLVTTDKDTYIKMSKSSISENIINLEGTVNKQITQFIPIGHPKRYFLLRLENAIDSAKIEYYGKFIQKKLPNTNVYLITETNHSIETAINEILKNSNNYIAETVFKIAGSKFVKNTGSLSNSQKMLTNYFDKLNLNYDNIKIVDGSGVSKNNLMTTDFMTQFLAKEEVMYILKEELPTAGEGTLKNRMLYFKDNIKAKTGTLSDVSSISGYITSRSGKTYAFDIMINDSKTKMQDKKLLEEYILRDIYANY